MKFKERKKDVNNKLSIKISTIRSHQSFLKIQKLFSINLRLWKEVSKKFSIANHANLLKLAKHSIISKKNKKGKEIIHLLKI
jgi:hypothetical protein